MSESKKTNIPLKPLAKTALNPILNLAKQSTKEGINAAIVSQTGPIGHLARPIVDLYVNHRFEKDVDKALDVAESLVSNFTKK